MRKYDTYEDSGIEWIGEIPGHWGAKRLKFLSSINDDVLPEGTPDDYEIEYVDISSVESLKGITKREVYNFGDAPSRARRTVRNGDLIVSTVRTYLKAIARIQVAPQNLVVSTGFAVIRPKQIESKYLGHLFFAEHLLGEIISRSVGISYPAINSSEIGQIYVPLPPLPEQTAIAAYLDRKTAEIDELIESKRRLLELYEEEKTAFINQAVTRGINPDAPMKDSGIDWLGEVPAHWEVKKVKHLLKKKKGALKTGPFGSQLKTSDLVPDGPYKVYNQRHVLNNWFHDGEDRIDEAKFANLREFLVENDDILFTSRGTIGKCAVFPSNCAKGVLHPCLIRIQIDDRLVIALSRLNRTCPGKEDTFVLDFANDWETIRDSFQPYYEVTTVKEETDVNHLYDLKARLDQFQVYWETEIEAFSNVYFNPANKLGNPKEQRHLYAFTDPAVDRFRAIPEGERRDEFKKGLRTWTNLYSFLSQIMPFTDVEFEKFYAYARLLQTRLPKRDLSESLELDDEVALEYYRLEKIKEGAIELAKGANGELSGTSEAGLKRSKEEEAFLSEIITVLNERFGTEFEEADKLFFDQIEAELMEDETLQTQARVNKLDTFKFAFNDKFIDKLIERMDQNQDIFEKILEDKVFGDFVKELMMKKIYKRLNE